MEPLVCRLRFECNMGWDEIKRTTVFQAKMLLAHNRREQEQIAMERELAKRAL